MELSFVLAAVAILFSTIFLYDVYLNSRLDPHEPPILKAPNSTPIIGHIIGFARHGIEYYTKLCHKSVENPAGSNIAIKQTDLPANVPSIFTVRVLNNFKLYVVNSTSMLLPLQRAAKTLSFAPFKRLTIERFSHGTPEELKFLDYPSDIPASGDGNFMHEITRAMTTALAPGPDLDKMNEVTASGFSEAVDDLVKRCNESGRRPGETVLDLYEWIRDTVTIYSGRGTWGPESMFNDKEARDAFWAFETDANLILLGLSPLFPKATQGMKQILPHFYKYHESDAALSASGLIREREKSFRAAGLTREQIARWSWALSVGVFSNTVPTSFWMIWELFSRPELLKELREGLKVAVTTASVPGSTQKQHTLSLSNLKAHVPLLLSVFQEMQRMRTYAATIRKVLVDTTLDDGRGRSYLLKAGNYVQFPSQPVHRNPALFGEDAHEFNPKRFLNAAQVKTAPERVTDPATNSDGDANAEVKVSTTKRATQTPFLPFGFAPILCPGRQFAVSEILILAALITLRFDIEPVDGQGWDEKWLKTKNGVATTPSVVNGKMVTMKVRPEYEGAWKVEVGKSGERFKLAGG